MEVLQLIVNGLMAGTILAVPAIGLTAIFAVLRFTNFALASHMTIGAFAGFVANWHEPRLRRLSLAGFSFCWAQFCVSAFTVVACVQSLDMSLIAAGTVLMTVQIANAIGRMIEIGRAHV